LLGVQVRGREEHQIHQGHPPEQAGLDGGEGKYVGLGRLNESFARPEPAHGSDGSELAADSEQHRDEIVAMYSAPNVVLATPAPRANSAMMSPSVQPAPQCETPTAVTA
jgi:hypothetical protein